MDNSRVAVLLEVLLSQIRSIQGSLEELQKELKNLCERSQLQHDALKQQIADLSSQDRLEHQQQIQMTRRSRLGPF